MPAPKKNDRPADFRDAERRLAAFVEAHLGPLSPADQADHDALLAASATAAAGRDAGRGLMLVNLAQPIIAAGLRRNLIDETKTPSERAAAWVAVVRAAEAVRVASEVAGQHPAYGAYRDQIERNRRVGERLLTEARDALARLDTALVSQAKGRPDPPFPPSGARPSPNRDRSVPASVLRGISNPRWSAARAGGAQAGLEGEFNAWQTDMAGARQALGVS